MSTSTAQSFMNRPLDFFEESVSKMHSIPRDELEELQREAMIVRFAEHRESIEMVRKLADRLGVTSVDKFDDVVPLMFSHTAYKSYPPALVDNNRWDLMTRWLDKLTTYDLSAVDVKGCDSIDEWLDRLEAQTPLQVVTSSGNTIQRFSEKKDGQEDKISCAATHEVQNEAIDFVREFQS